MEVETIPFSVPNFFPRLWQAIIPLDDQFDFHIPREIIFGMTYTSQIGIQIKNAMEMLEIDGDAAPHY